MTDLTDKEQQHVRTTLRFLRLRCGSWAPLAAALRVEYDTIEKVANNRGRAVTARIAFRVARFVEAPIDDLLAGRWLPSRTCPNCGHTPDDFTDEETRPEPLQPEEERP